MTRREFYTAAVGGLFAQPIFAGMQCKPAIGLQAGPPPIPPNAGAPYVRVLGLDDAHASTSHLVGLEAVGDRVVYKFGNSETRTFTYLSRPPGESGPWTTTHEPW